MWAVGFLIGIVGGVLFYAIYLTIVTLIHRKKEKNKIQAETLNDDK